MGKVVLLVHFQLSWGIGYWPLLLHQYTPQALIRRVAIHLKPLTCVWYSKYWSCGTLLHLLKALITLLCPGEWLVFSTKLGQRTNHFREPFHKSSVISGQFQEALYLSHSLWSFPFQHCINLAWIHCNTMCRNNVPHKLYLFQPELALIQLAIELMFSEYC